MNWPDFKNKCSKYFWFTKKELNHFLILTFIFAFMFSFNEWGGAAFDLASGIRNLVIALIIVGISLFAHHATQRLVSLKVGLKPENRIWWPGVLIGLIFIIFSNGNIMVFAGSYVLVHMMRAHRLGKHRFGPNMKTWGYIAMSGPLANVLLAALAKGINYGIGSVFLEKFVLFNFLFAIYSALPFPPLDGSRMFFASRMAYAFFAGAIYGYLILIYVFGFYGLGAIAASVLIGCACWVGCYVFLEKKAMPL